jgi:spore maturation protein CgeB
MKCLFLPLNVPGSEQVGQARGMREVFDEVVEFDYMNHPEPNIGLINLCATQQFDVAWMQLQDTKIITPHTLEAIKPHVKLMTQWNGDIREIVPEYQQKIAPLFDITYLGYDQIREYSKYCNNVKTMMIAVDPVEIGPLQSPESDEKEYDVVFIGNHYNNQFPASSERLELIKLLKSKFNVLVLGNGWPDGLSDGSCPVKDQANWYRKGKVCLSINHFNNVKYYSERLLWCLGSGTPTILRRTPDLEFIENEYYLGFDDANECVRQIDLILQYPERFKEMGIKAHDEVLNKHNWTQRFNKLKEDYDDRCDNSLDS